MNATDSEIGQSSDTEGIKEFEEGAGIGYWDRVATNDLLYLHICQPDIRISFCLC